ncbi:MAG: DUF2007 domain-containing protein [candidate division WOR-3 bacterium]|nr:DUF2007 domain-containing protein [candidate division WOR-3 bacterium]MCX7837211.1 DUF2007 domain-containing protein [candidate division WOR-3 bacterium]MDW8114603.1 DUF2007 domain-containing protein [candidate division WOR-3 bacterium]
MALKVLYKPKDEIEAITIQSFLESIGIKAVIRSYDLPYFDGIAKMMRSEWGEILVLEEDFGKAKEFLEDFFSQKND